MLKEDIHKAFETVRPDEDAKKRMLKNIRSCIPPDSAGKEKKMIKKYTKRSLRVAVVLAAVLIMTMAVCAAGFLRLKNLSIGKEKIEDETHQEQEVDMISLSGYADSPEHQACVEWNKFLEEYDADDAILSSIGNSPTGLEEEYGEYLCYTQEMADKIDEICETYQLSKLKGFQIAESYEELCSLAQTGDFFGNPSKNVKLEDYGGYVYADGSFHIEGNAILSGESLCTTDYQIIRSMKGTFHPAMLNVWDMDQYREWTYRTGNGEELLLANSSTKALIIAEREKSFVVVNLLGNIMSGNFDVSDEMLQNLAETFDFSAIP